ncbi:MAG: substrate-binding domain-containing protein [Sedimentisphaeraceae bacterium JB056]
MQNTMTKLEKVSSQLWETVRTLREKGENSLPPEIVLCDEYNVSRGTIRRAMNELVDKGVLRRVAGKGTFICEERTAEAAESGTIPMIGLAYDVVELSEFRMMNIRAIARAAHSCGLGVMVCSLSEAMGLLGSWFPTQRGPARLMGLISCNFPKDMIEEIKKSPVKIPYVALVNPEYENIADYAVLRLDEFKILYEFLCEKGHRRFCFLEDVITTESINRTNQAIDHINDMGYEISVITKEFFSDRMRAAEEVDHVLSLPEEERPTVIICYDDKLAAWVIRHLTKNGIRVPEDISVIGRGNLDIAACTTPAITSLCIFYDDLAKKAMELFLAQLSGEDIDEPIKKVGYRIIERESVADIN